MNATGLSNIAQTVLEQEETDSARIVNRVRYLILILITLPIFHSSYTTGAVAGIIANTSTVLGYLTITAIHTVVIRRSNITWIRRFNYIAIAADMLILIFNIFYWGLTLSADDFSFLAKTPSWIYVFLVIVLAVLQFQTRVVYLGLGIFLVAYVTIVGIMFAQGVTLTGDWVAYVQGPAVEFADLVISKPTVVMIVGMTVAYSIRKSISMVRKISTAETNRAQLSRYFSPAIVEDITSNTELATEVRRQKATILFLDIRNFTKISERVDAELLVEWLSDFRARLTGIIFKHQGTVDKFIGDAILATFGTPRPSPIAGEDSTNAVRCALEMMASLEGLNQKWREHGIETRIGIGIHSGEVIAGNIGDADQIEYTVIGDPVNTASRIESLCKKLDQEIIISNAVQAELLADFAMRRLPRVRVKGKELPLELYGLITT